MYKPPVSAGAAKASGKIKPPTKEELKAVYDKAEVIIGVRSDQVGSGIPRAGIIPWTLDAVSKEIWFAVGVDRQYGEITDFGGAVSRWELPIAAAMRELEEESAGIFKKDIVRDISCAVTDSESSVIFFARVDPTDDVGFPDTLPAKMEYAIETHTNRTSVIEENSTAYWLPSRDLVAVSKCRTRPALKTTYHESPVTTDSVGRATARKLQELSGTSRKAGMGDRHPLMYEKIRRILFPVLPEVISILKEESE